MVPSTETVGTLEIVDSMNCVEFDVDAGCFRAEYDSDRDSTSLAVVAVVGVADNRDPFELAPLHATVDTGALDDLFAASTDETRRGGRVSFAYEGFGVSVRSEGTIEASPYETERPNCGGMNVETDSESESETE